MTSQRIGKYACLELERRYLLRHLPVELAEDAPFWQIIDHYVVGTRLRLRSMIASSQRTAHYKLGQKFRTADQGAVETTMTNIYLTETEYARLMSLEANELRKRRFEFSSEGRRYSIDLFQGRHQGLILAETECETVEELAALAMPIFALRDVTEEPFFSGGFLASLSESEFSRRFAIQLQAETMSNER